jgi:hypothetical protein
MKEIVSQDFFAAAGAEDVIMDAFQRHKDLHVQGAAGDFLVTPLDDRGMVEGGLMRLAMEGHLPSDPVISEEPEVPEV